jgi:hypothetical protein
MRPAAKRSEDKNETRIPRTAIPRAVMTGVLMAAVVSAALAASARLNGYFAPDFKDAAYQRKAVDKVIKSWKPPAPFPAVGKKTVVISRIARDGALVETRFNLKAGSEGWDDAAMAAVKSAAPFAALPKSYGQPVLEVHWHFEVGK